MKYDHLFMSERRRAIFEKYEKKDYRRKDRLRVFEYENGIILPCRKNENPIMWGDGGVLDADGNFVEESKVRNLFGGYYEYNEDFLRYRDEEVIYFGPFVKHWGHFICDFINRLWYVMDNPDKYKIAYCGRDFWDGVSDMSGNFMEVMEALGVKREQLINVQCPTRFRKVIMPEKSLVPREYYSDEYVKLIDTIVGGVPMDERRQCPEKIYFSRLRLPGNDRDYGEDKIAKYLEDNGFAIMSPEFLSFTDQVFYLNNAKEIYMTAGSISHNLIFAGENLEAVILNKFEMPNGYQLMIDQFTKARVSYVDAFRKLLPVSHGAGPFLLRVNKYLAECVGSGRSIKKYRSSFADYKGYFRKYWERYILDPSGFEKIREERSKK